MTRLSKPVALFILSLWAGAAILFAAVAAPTLFNPAVLDNRELSGIIAGAILKRFYTISYYAFGLTLLITLLGWLADPKGAGRLKWLFFICLAAFALNAIQDKILRPEMVRLKLEIKNASGPGREAELRGRFDFQHRLSTWLYGGATLAVLAGIVLAGVENSGGGRGRK